MNLQKSSASLRERSLVSATRGPGRAAPERTASPQALQADGKSLWRAMALFVVLQSASAILQLLSGTVTAVYFGQLLGPSALAVASAFFPVFVLLVSFLIGLVSGGIVLVGRAHGAGDPLQIKRVMGTTLCLCTSLSIVVAALGYRFSPELLDALQTPADIRSAAVTYARVTFASLPVLTVFFAYTHLVRGTGDALTPFLGMALCVTINLILVPALILGWAGLPALGSASAPWANLVACAISLAVLLVYLRVRAHPLAFDRTPLSRVRVDGRIAAEFLAIGVPAGVQLAMISLSEVAVVFLVNAFGSRATAAYGALIQVAGFVLAPGQGVGVAATVFAAQVIGAGKAARIGMVTRTAALLGITIEAVVVGLVYAFASNILSWFITDPVTLSIAWRALLISLWSFLLVGPANVLAGVMRATGTVVWPAAISISATWFVGLPSAYALSLWIGIDGLWIGYPAGFVVSLVGQWIYYRLVWECSSQRAAAG